MSQAKAPSSTPLRIFTSSSENWWCRAEGEEQEGEQRGQDSAVGQACAGGSTAQQRPAAAFRHRTCGWLQQRSSRWQRSSSSCGWPRPASFGWPRPARTRQHTWKGCLRSHVRTSARISSALPSGSKRRPAVAPTCAGQRACAVCHVRCTACAPLAAPGQLLPCRRRHPLLSHTNPDVQGPNTAPSAATQQPPSRRPSPCSAP